jgi:hypothetical protein
MVLIIYVVMYLSKLADKDEIPRKTGTVYYKM